MRLSQSFVLSLLFLLMTKGVSFGQAHVTKEPVAKDGTPVQVHLPESLHLRNTGGSDGPRGPGSGSGLCVFTSINLAAYLQNVEALQGFQSWMTRHPGGGTPSKVDRMIDLYCTQQKTERLQYIQVVSNDLDILRLALNTGRMGSVTYGLSPTGRYGGRKVPHMVNIYAAGAGQGPDGKGWWCVQDNNYPGTYEWMSESQFRAAYGAYGKGWAVILLSPCPPPVPAN